MEIYRRMGLPDRIRAAGLPADVPMDVFIVLDVVEPPLLHKQISVGDGAQGGDRGDP